MCEIPFYLSPKCANLAPMNNTPAPNLPLSYNKHPAPRTRGQRGTGFRAYRQDAIVDLMLAEPELTIVKIAARLKITPQTVSNIIHSDAFQMLYEERRRTHNTRLSEAIETKLKAVAMGALDLVNERIAQNPASVTTGVAIDVASKALERLGYGVKLPGQVPGVVVNNQQVIVASSADVMAARDLIRANEAKTIEHSTQTAEEVVTFRPFPAERQTPKFVLDANDLPVEVKP